METRETDFNIMLATDSYKVRPKAITLLCVAGVFRDSAGINELEEGSTGTADREIHIGGISL
ncbi:hypothetical protein CCH79_00015194 [Gambusia affinis]|uniref:Uncharacterized protein n=1 Tax=Gambusia affinis TaxID=33528 RepID=A0A315VSI3_GAMAF|nr:hypothetical protein CCH79_00015194 [Gambusia affinis]